MAYQVNINSEDVERVFGGAASDDLIIPRDIRFDLSSNPKRKWLGNDIYRTANMDCLSIFLPEGERLFIRSLKHYRKKLNDPELSKQISGYMIQEAFHTREHEDYNRAMTKLGIDVDKLEKPVRFSLRQIKHPQTRLITTCAIEHLTATYSTMIWRKPELLADAYHPYRLLWLWHALEELEHKSVAFNVFQAVTEKMPRWKRYWLRITGMNLILISFFTIHLRNVRLYALDNGSKVGLRFWLKYWKVMFINPGYVRISLMPLLRYYLPGFKPADDDDAELIRKAKRVLYNELQGMTSQGRES